MYQAVAIALLVFTLGLGCSFSFEEAEDPRISPILPAGLTPESILERHSELGFWKRLCVARFHKRYRQAVYDHCIANDLGRNVGGGCAHVAGYAFHSGVLAAAIQECGAG